ncbi:MAG TPA: hypothetical protein VF727_15080 [Allosphingosinicella sp.]|jgi:hypothetical protein
MDPISNVDRLAMLLRQRLAERAKAEGRKSERKGGSGAGDVKGRRAVEALASVEGVDERQLRRALVENVLADQLGPELLNEAKFQQVVERVTETLTEHPGTARLLDRVLGEMRRPRR